MKYCINIRCRAGGALEGDNLRGERRWERHVARALLNAGRNVGSVEDSWDQPDTLLWEGRVTQLSGYTLITEAYPSTVSYLPGADVFITDAYTVLSDEAEAEIRRAVADMGRNRVALTHAFQIHVPQKRLSEDLHDLIHWLPVPALPRVYWSADNFSQKTLLWSGRAIHLYLSSPSQSTRDLLDWIRGCLLGDPEMMFEILLGEEGIDQAAADAWVWRFPVFEEVFGDLRHRVKVHPSISWIDVQTIYARTKLVVNSPMAFGGPPIEAASFGIPVAGKTASAFHAADMTVLEPSRACWSAFPEFVEIGVVGAPTFVEQLDVWFRDHATYRRVGDAYRNFVGATYTYEAFVRHLDALPVFR